MKEFIQIVFVVLIFFFIALSFNTLFKELATIQPNVEKILSK